MSKSQVYGIIGSFASCLCVLLILLFVYIDVPQKEEDEGILVSFGDAEMGAGYGEWQEIASLAAAPPPTPSTPANSEMMTQEDEPSLEVPKQSETDKRKQAEQAELLRRKQQEEQARIEAERRAQEQAEAERKRQQEAIDKAAKLGGVFGSNQGSDGSGNTRGDGRQGNPVGQGSSGGNSWSLNGRSLNGRLAEPVHNTNVEGRVVVVIRVNAAGRVISTSVGPGTTISDVSVRNAAIKAAQQARFTAGTGEVSGTITYNFKLR